MFFVCSPYFSLSFTIAPIKLHWPDLHQINKPANKKLLKVSVINISLLENVLTLWTSTCCRAFMPCFNEANDRGKMDHWGERKPYYTSISMVWWHVYRFLETASIEVLTKQVNHFDQRRLLIYSPARLLRICKLHGDFKI